MLSVSVAERASDLVPVLTADVARALPIVEPPRYEHAGGMNFVVCWCAPSDAQRGIQLALLAVLVTSFPAGLTAINFATARQYRGRRWSGWWLPAFRAGVVLQGGTIGISLSIVAMAASLLFVEPEAFLIAATIFGPSLFISVAAMPAWFRLQPSLMPAHPPTLLGATIR